MIPIEGPDPIEAIRFRMEQAGLRQCDLVKAGCGSPSHVSEILNYKRDITKTFIRAYHKLCPEHPPHILIKYYPLKTSDRIEAAHSCNHSK